MLEAKKKDDYELLNNRIGYNNILKQQTNFREILHIP